MDRMYSNLCSSVTMCLQLLTPYEADHVPGTPLDAYSIINFESSMQKRSYPFNPGTTRTRVSQVVKNLPANAADAVSIPGSGRSPGGGNDNPLQCSCLENPMCRGAWWAAVHRVAKSQAQLSSTAAANRNKM